MWEMKNNISGVKMRESHRNRPPLNVLNGSNFCQNETHEPMSTHIPYTCGRHDRWVGNGHITHILMHVSYICMHDL